MTKEKSICSFVSENEVSSIVPSAKDIAQSLAKSVIKLEITVLKENIAQALEAMSDVATSVENADTRIGKMSISLGVSADGRVGLIGVASGRKQVVSTVTVEFNLNA